MLLNSLLLGLAALKIAFGVAGYVASAPIATASAHAAVPSGFGLVHMLVYGIIAALLIHNRNRDPRALWLGTALCLVAVVPADRLFASLGDTHPWMGSATFSLAHLHPDTFIPLSFWLFFRSFPRSSPDGWARLAARIGIATSALSGVVLFVAHASPLIATGRYPGLDTLVAPLAPSDRLYLYTWLALIGLTVPAFAFAVWRIRSAPLSEAHRVGLFVAGIVMGSITFFGIVFLKAVSPTLRVWLDLPDQQWVNYVVRLGLMSIPLTTAYSVLVHHVLDVKLVVRRALQYALARYAVMAATAIPFVALVVYIYRNRSGTIADLLSGTGPIVLIAATIVGLVMLQTRQAVLDGIDRRFFREHYDSQQILMSLVEGSRRATSPWELAQLLSHEIDRALHLENISIFVLDPTHAELRSDAPDSPPIVLASPMAVLVSDQEQPLTIDWDLELSAVARLPALDQQWLRRTGVELMVPFMSSDGTLVGVAALGAKKSERPFSREDRQLLATIAGSAALTLENRIRVSSSGDGSTGLSDAAEELPELALECTSCDRVMPHDTAGCRSCDGELRRATVPYVLASKFKLEQRIGAGGMGVVYRAVDLALGRRVAMKTLPKLSMEFASRLRREARAMATVAHNNLALIYGVESWRGSPLLIVELLEGGSLTQRLSRGRLSLEEALELGITLADVLEVLHRAGILHRDLKPGNVGFTNTGVPKLLDFGLAKILGDSRLASGGGAPAYEDFNDVPTSALSELTATRCAVGTPIYLSPEAARGEEPTPLFDLWALAIVLFEAAAGVHPLRLQDTAGLRDRIFEGRVADIRSVVPDIDEGAAAFFSDAFSPETHRRPQTAAEFRQRLQAVAHQLTPLTAAS